MTAPTQDDIRSAIIGASPSAEEVLARVDDQGIKFVNLQFTDVVAMTIYFEQHCNGSFATKLTGCVHYEAP